MQDMVATQLLTLREMRDARGYTAEKVGVLLAQKLGRKQPYHFSTILKHEAVGVELYKQIEAYSVLYDRPISEVAVAGRKKHS